MIMLAGCCWALLVLGPDAQTVKNTMQDTQDSVLKYFVSITVQLWLRAGARLACSTMAVFGVAVQPGSIL